MSVETADTSGLFDSTPVFPDWTEEQLEMVGMEITTSSDPSFSSTMSIHVPPSAYYKRLHDDHMALLHCLQTYVPPSRPSSPARETRTDTLKDRVEKAWKSTGGEPTSGRWAQIAWLLRLGCTRGKFVVGGEQMHSVPPREWVLPDTEDEWCKLERGWREDDMRAKKRGTVAEGFASKGDAQTHPPNDDTTEDSDDHVAPKLAVQEQVKGWKVKVPDRVNTASKPVVTLYRDDPPAKTKERDPNDPSPLGFPVIKRPSGTLHAVKKGKPLGLADTPPSRPKDAARRSSTPEREAGPSDIRPRTASPKDLSMADPASSDPSADAPIIADLSEQSFFPPSFPSQLKKSTPKQSPAREKPAPIPTRLFFSSPSSSPHLPNSLPERHPRSRTDASSSQPIFSPLHKMEKRARPPTPPSDDLFAGISTQALAASPTRPLKKPRTNVSQSSGPPPTTPPRSDTPPLRSPVEPITPERVLGNAKGLPIHSTPIRDRNLPTLTDLLASTRRSKTRPRIRKNKGSSSSPHKEAEAETAVANPSSPRQRTPDPSPTKSHFSTPGSGSSTGSLPYRPLRSPVSPLFSQNPGAFDPPALSTQLPASDMLGTGSMGRGLQRGSSGFFGGMYNSQFDVESRVDRVSELLERDVDFDGWLRDLPPADLESSQPGDVMSQG